MNRVGRKRVNFNTCLSIAKLGHMSEEFKEMFLEIADEYVRMVCTYTDLNRKQMLDVQSIFLTLHAITHNLSPDSEFKNSGDVIAFK
jgi:hypothetical protein